jgi:hypothetical protein
MQGAGVLRYLRLVEAARHALRHGRQGDLIRNAVFCETNRKSHTCSLRREECELLSGAALLH